MGYRLMFRGLQSKTTFNVCKTVNSDTSEDIIELCEYDGDMEITNSIWLDKETAEALSKELIRQISHME
jgi:hypothetical protein